MTRFDFKAGTCFENNRMHIASFIVFDYINTLMQSQSYYDYIYFTIPLQFRKTIFFLFVDMTLSLGTIVSQEKQTVVQYNRIGFILIMFHLLFCTFFFYYFLVSQTSQTHFSLSLLSLFLSGSFVCRRFFGQLIVRKLVHFVYHD